MGNRNDKSYKSSNDMSKDKGLNDDRSKDKRLKQAYGDFNQVRFTKKVKGRWNPWSGAIHYQISLSPLREDDSKYVVGKDPFLHFVYAEHGYVVVDSKRLFVRTLSTVYEGEAKIVGKSIVLNCRKELQKCMRIEWTQDGKPPSARVISEQICVISPPSKLILRSSHNNSLLTLRKENMFVAKLWHSSSSGGVEERKNLNRLQALFGSKLQWVSETTLSITKQISIKDAQDHYENLDNLMTQYDPSLGNANDNDNEDNTSKGNDDVSDKENASSLSVDMFVARDLTKSHEDELLAVRDATTGKLVGVHDLAQPLTFPKNINTRRDSWTEISNRCVSPTNQDTENEETGKNVIEEEAAVYSSVIRLLGGGYMRSLMKDIRVKWNRSAQYENDDESAFVLTPPPKQTKRSSSRIVEKEEDEWGDFSAAIEVVSTKKRVEVIES
eukprot:g1634.t1